MDADTDDILEKVRAFAQTAHGNQMRKYSDEQYINHLVRVMEICRQYTHELPVLAACLLHDVLEDTEVTPRDLNNFLTSVLDLGIAAIAHHLVVELTDVYVKSDYHRWNRRSRKTKEAERLGNVSPEAQTIKYADIIDNTTDIANQRTGFALVYIREAKQMLLAMDKGIADLRERALATVDEALQAYFAKANIKAL